MENLAGKKRLCTALALTLALAPTAAWATTEVETPEIVVSATKTEKELQEVPSTVSLVDGEEAAQYGHNSIADMVQDVPGVEVFDNSIAGSKRLMIRGENGGRVIILIDGQKINEQKSMDGAPLLIDPATVDRIEVVKGAGSVLYGSEAIGGVVNIITQKGGEKAFGGTVSGSYNSGTSGYEGSLSLYGGATEGAYYRLTGSYSDQGDRETPDGTLEGSESLMKSISGVLGYKNKKVDIGVSLESYEIEADVPPIIVNGGPFDLDLPEWSRDKAGMYADFMDISELITKIHFDGYYQKTFKDFRQYMETPMDAAMGAPMGPPMGPPAGSSMAPPMGGGDSYGMPSVLGTNLHTDNDQKTYALNTQVDMVFLDSHYLITGVAYSNDTLDAVTDISFTMPFIPSTSTFQEASVNTWAVYLQDEWSLTEDIVLTYGVRETWVESELENTDDPTIMTGSVSDNHPAFSAGLTWNSTDDLTLRTLFSQGYRFPDLGKLFIGTTHGGSITLANPDLDPETSNNFEIGARYDNSRLKTDLSLFYNMAENYINRQPFGTGVYRYENVDEATTYGLEMWIGYRFSDPYNLMPYLNGTLMRRQYEDSTVSTWDTNTPLFSGRVGLRFERSMSASPATFWGDFYLRGATEAKEETEPGLVSTNDSWITTNLALGVKWGESEQWQASLNFNNILDESYTTAQNSLEETGMHVVAWLSYSF